MFAIGWRYIIPKFRYSKSKIGSFVFHDSLLPKYRGFSPSVWAIRNGENETGATLFKISANMDEGDVLDQRRITISDEDFIDTVVDKVTDAYLSMIDENFQRLIARDYDLTPQNHENATYTCMLKPEDFQIDLNRSATDIYNLIRSYVYPYSYAFFFLSDQKIRVKTASVKLDRQYVGSIPGRVVEIIPGIGVDVVTFDNVIRIETIILADNTICSADKVINMLSYTLS